MSIKITGYNAICNLGNDIDSIYENALAGKTDYFDHSTEYLDNTHVRLGRIQAELKNIPEENFNTRANQLLLKNLELVQTDIDRVIKEYGSNRIGIVASTTNSGVEEFEKSNNSLHFQLGSPAYFLHKHLKLDNYYASVSTACSSGLKAFSLARDLLKNEISDCVIVVSVDPITKLPIYGFNSLEILSPEVSIPFSKNRKGMNLGEASAVFILEKNKNNGIEILGLGENSDIYHSTTPDPQGVEAVSAIKSALNDAGLSAEDIDYINTHGTGTAANDLMESNAISKIFSKLVPVSSTKPMTGHCLGAAAGIETALCCKLLEDFRGYLYPHIFDGNYDNTIPPLNLVKKNQKYKKCKICMCNSFGFGGTNAILILGSKNG